MTREWLDKTLVNLMSNCNGYLSGSLSYKLMKGDYPRISEYMMNRYESFNEYRETFIRMKYHIEEHPRCKICGNPTSFSMLRHRKIGLFYGIYCSASCSGKDQDRIEKSKDTKKIKYGSSGYNNRERARETCLKKYGVDNPRKADVVKKKSEETCLRKYGVRCPTQLKSVIEYTHTRECIDRQNNTKRKNHTFNSSKTEEYLYDILIEEFGKEDVIRQYNDKERYPWNCDFYVKSIDTFIELQGHWTHGEHPYDKDNIEDAKILEEWETRGTRYYSNAIRCWTITDVKKREIAKKNKINYIEIFSIKKDEIKKIVSILKMNKNNDNNEDNKKSTEHIQDNR